MNTCSADLFREATNNTALQALYCHANVNFHPECFGLCPNPDLSGIGVRIAFYSQAFMNAMLIFLSPEDAAAGAWASTILTGALVIPALRSKMEGELTLHHATLVLNFCTLSTIASAATAPMVPIWRVVRRGRGSDVAAFRQEQDERARGRIILSLALGAQIVLQWSWTVVMFVDPFYKQEFCSGCTTIVYIAGFRKADDINEQFASWAIWLLLCISSSLIFGVVMVFSCPSEVHETSLKYDHIESDTLSIKGRILRWLHCIKHFLYPKDDTLLWERCWIRISQLFAFAIVVGFFALSELQIRENRVLPGENEIWNFSQSAAVFLALSPIWPIGIAWLRKHKSSLLPVHHWNHYYDASIADHAPSLRPAPSFPDTPTFVPDPFSTDQLMATPPDSFGVVAGNMRNMTYDPYDPTGRRMSYTDPFSGHSASPSTYGPPSPQPPGESRGGGEQMYMPLPTFAVDAPSDGEDSVSGGSTTTTHNTREEHDRPPESPSSLSFSSRHERRSSLLPSSPTRRPTGPRMPGQRLQDRSRSDLSSLGEGVDGVEMEEIQLMAMPSSPPRRTTGMPSVSMPSLPIPVLARPKQRSSSSVGSISGLRDGGLGPGAS
ncbi:hypothetical protein M407DRAFT_23209 [Tulasnella calospora MUT 4182]|uniref:Uncharacterized protein n=1 Tax=Tulasnella calospora MUT 4182 TaxID=1051891 RepID=A0A0C3QAX6_9AGAM|nr:hypothetical protein M407DRAFT_23209 [Tulasnella calospora MUT 4182]